MFTQIPKILEYLPVTLELTIFSAIIGLLPGLLIAVTRMRKIPILSQIGVAFVSLIRGASIIIQLYLIYFTFPIALKYYNFYHGTNYNTNGNLLETPEQGMVFQQFNLFKQKTVGMLDHLYHYPQHLSGGQQQRVGIARALAMNPEFAKDHGIFLSLITPLCLPIYSSR